MLAAILHAHPDVRGRVLDLVPTTTAAIDRFAAAGLGDRAGAVSGLMAVAIQSIWDTGLRTPANGVLFAVIAAIALHEPRAAHEPPAARHPSRRPPSEKTNSSS